MVESESGLLKGSRVVTVRLAGETYGIPIDVVEGIVRWEPLTRIARTPAFVLGVFKVRGRVVPVIDLRTRLGLEASAQDDKRRILLLEIGGQWVGVLVDSVEEVAWIPSDVVEDTCGLMMDGGAEMITGVAKLERGLVILLDPARLVSPDEEKRLVKLAVKQNEEKAALAA